MENEGNLYEIADQYGYSFNDRVSSGRYHTQLGMTQRERNYVEWDIEANSLGTIRALETMRRSLETAATVDLQSFADRVGYSE